MSADICTYELLERRVQLADSVFKNEADGTVGAIFGKDILHDTVGVFEVLSVIKSDTTLDNANTDNLVAVVH